MTMTRLMKPMKKRTCKRRWRRVGGAMSFQVLDMTSIYKLCSWYPVLTRLDVVFVASTQLVLAAPRGGTWRWFHMQAIVSVCGIYRVVWPCKNVPTIHLVGSELACS